MNLEKIKELIEISKLLENDVEISKKETTMDKFYVGRKVIIRTYSAGVHFGEVVEKEGKEIILKNARRLWYWKTSNNGISLSEVANEGLHSDSKVCQAVENIWLEAIEIIPCSPNAIKNIEAQNEYKS